MKSITSFQVNLKLYFSRDRCSIQNAGQAILFPRGSIHFEPNLNFERAVFVAAFNSQDLDMQRTGNVFFLTTSH